MRKDVRSDFDLDGLGSRSDDLLFCFPLGNILGLGGRHERRSKRIQQTIFVFFFLHVVFRASLRDCSLVFHFHGCRSTTEYAAENPCRCLHLLFFFQAFFRQRRFLRRLFVGPAVTEEIIKPTACWWLFIFLYWCFVNSFGLFLNRRLPLQNRGYGRKYSSHATLAGSHALRLCTVGHFLPRLPVISAKTIRQALLPPWETDGRKSRCWRLPPTFTRRGVKIVNKTGGLFVQISLPGVLLGQGLGNIVQSGGCRFR
mmetsp:Transcript_6329/g.13094  ORF Transcript_6329/g.13094 Transcript_6329/m.13094 type:complete len:256 (-) Transcript_6329:341-1108(-)